MINFDLDPFLIKSYFDEEIPRDFQTLCQLVQHLSTEHLANEEAYHLVIKERKGSDAAKHAFLTKIAWLHGIEGIELIAGIFLAYPEDFPKLATQLESRSLSCIPSIRCYLRYQGKRFDFSGIQPNIQLLESTIVREQGMEPHQSFDWKNRIFEHYLEKWIVRKGQIELSAADILHLQTILH